MNNQENKPFAAPAGQHEAIVGAVARGLGAPDCRYDELDTKVVDAIVREVEDALASGFRAQGGNTNSNSPEFEGISGSDLAPTTSTVQELPLGALHNGEALANRLENIYDFECEAGPLRNCYEWTELLRCMAAIREWFASTTSTVSAPDEIRNAALEEAAKRIDELAAKERDVPGRCSLAVAKAAAAVRALRTTSTEGGAA